MALDDFEKELLELEERLPKKKKRRFAIWWFSGLAIAMMFASFLFYNNTNTDSVVNLKTTSNSNKEISKPILSNKINQQKPIVNNTSSLSTKNKSISNKVVSNISKSSNYVSPINDKNKPLLISQNQNHLISKNVISNKPQITFSQKATTALPKTILPKPIERISVSHLSSLIFYLKISNPEITIKNNYYKKYISPTPSPKEKGKNSSKTNWSIALGYTFGANQFKRKTTVVDIQNQIDFLSDYEKQIDYMAIHFKIYKNLNKHLSLFTGIHASQHTNLFQLSETFGVERNNPSTLLEEHYLLTGLLEQIYGPGVDQYDVTIQSKLWQKYQSIGIPLGISIHSDLDKKWSIQNDFAWMIHPFQKTSGRKIIKTDNDYFIFDNDTYSPQLFSSLNNQLNLNWKMTNSFYLKCSADMGIDLNSRLKTGNQYDLRFSYFGIGLSGQLLF